MAPIVTPQRPDRDAHAEELLEHFERLEEQFRQVRDGLMHSHRLTTLGTIATIIAHEYNNILTPILSYAQLALARPDDPALMRKAVEHALSGAQRACHISSSLLGFARESDSTGAARLRGVIDDTLACLARDVRKDNIELTVEVPDLELGISAQKLQQVLLNLVLNAKQAMKPRGGRLRITAQGDGGQVRISVADSGPGIPPEIVDRLFQPFVTFRPPSGGGSGGASAGSAGSAGSAPTKGTGLGLCICRDLVQAAGGEITVESAPGRGATFHIVLPLAPPAYEST